MKILYVGKFERPHRTENYVTTALETLGCTVVKFPITNSNLNLLPNVRRETERLVPDLVLFSKSSFMSIKPYVRWLRSKDIKTVCWLWDLFFGFGRRLPFQATEVDLVFSTDGGHQQDFIKRNIDHRVLRQGIAKQHAYKLPTEDYDYDVAFIGSVYNTHRERLVGWLKHNYGSRFIHHTTTRGDKLNQAISRTKIIVGDSFPSPHYWSNRIYEVLGRGGFFLHPETEGLDSEFQDGTHYASYPDCRRGGFTGLRDTIETFLQDDDRRAQIASTGFARVYSNYTYEDRCRELLEACA